MDAKKVEQVDEIKEKEPEIQENQSYPVEVKSHEQSQNSVEEDIDSTIKISARIGFIRKVYGILSIQLLITFGSVILSQLKPVKYYINHNPIFSTNLLIISSVLFLVFFLSLACCKGISRRVPYNYLFLFGITLSQAISCSIAASIYSFQIVSTALLLTIVATLAITFYACTTKNNFAICRIGLYVILAQMFTIGIVAVFFRIRALYTFYTFCSTILMGIYLVYDTQLIMGKIGVGYSIDDYIFASLEIYMDIVRLFLLILKIIGNSNSNRH
jgi:FtsH-binding integral membrane protein